MGHKTKLKRKYYTLFKKSKKSKKIYCKDNCYKKIYKHSDRIKYVCHWSINYIWKILTNNAPNNLWDRKTLNIKKLKTLIFTGKEKCIYAIDIAYTDSNHDYDIHTFLIERNKNKYKIYQSYIIKYTMQEWLNGKLNKNSKCRENYSHLSPTKLSTFSIKDQTEIKEITNNNKNLFRYFPICVKEFGGNNCISKSKLNRFLNLLNNFLKMFGEHNITKTNMYSRQIFGWDGFTDNKDTEEQTYIPPTSKNIRLLVNSHDVICERL